MKSPKPVRTKRMMRRLRKSPQAPYTICLCEGLGSCVRCLHGRIFGQLRRLRQSLDRVTTPPGEPGGFLEHAKWDQREQTASFACMWKNRRKRLWTLITYKQKSGESHMYGGALVNKKFNQLLPKPVD